MKEREVNWDGTEIWVPSEMLEELRKKKHFIVTSMVAFCEMPNFVRFTRPEPEQNPPSKNSTAEA